MQCCDKISVPAIFSNHRYGHLWFWHCYENGLIMTIQTIPHNLYVSVKLTSLYCGLRIILIFSKGKLTWHLPTGCGVSFESIWWAPSRFHSSDPCLLILVFITDWKVVWWNRGQINILVWSDCKGAEVMTLLRQHCIFYTHALFSQTTLQTREITSNQI